LSEAVASVPEAVASSSEAVVSSSEAGLFVVRGGRLGARGGRLVSEAVVSSSARSSRRRTAALPPLGRRSSPCARRRRRGCRRSGGGGEIDSSNASSGYSWPSTRQRVQGQAAANGPSGVTYTYNLRKKYDAFPLTAGSGSYTANIYENISGNQYALALGTTIPVTLASTLLPSPATRASTSAHRRLGPPSPRAKRWPLGFYGAGRGAERLQLRHRPCDYDSAKASSLTSGYLPSPDETLSSGKGLF
jgi:hypothetical protein